MVDRPWVKHVKSNIKGGVDCDLGRKTLIVGGNSTGKSAVINAVELALAKKASDIAGRDLSAQESFLMSLAPGRAGDLFTEVTLSDGVTARWSTSANSKGTGVKKATHSLPPGINPDTVLPLWAIRAAAVASPETARPFFLRQVAGKVSEADVLALIPEALHLHYKQLLISCNQSDSPLDKLLAAVEQSGQNEREARSRAAAQKSAAAISAEGLGAPATDEQMTEVEALVTARKTALQNAHQLHSQAAASRRAAEQLPGARTQLLTLKGELQDLQKTKAILHHDRDAAALAAASLSDAGVSQLQKALVIALKEHVGKDQCLVCTSKISISIKERAEYFEKLVGAKIADAKKKAELEIQVRELDSSIVTVGEKLDWKQNQVTSVSANLKVLEDNLDENGEEPALPSINAAMDALTEAEEALRTLVGRQAAWKVANKARDQQVEASRQESDWTLLKKACSDAIEKLLDTNLDKLVKRTQSRLPASDKFVLRLREGTRAVFQLGFEQADGLHTALCGAEWAKAIAALADACAPDTGPSVIIPEDRGWDARTLADALAALSSTESQVIIASTTMPSVIPEDWTVIQTDAGMHQGAAAPVSVKGEPVKDVTPRHAPPGTAPGGNPVTPITPVPSAEIPKKRRRRTKAEIEADTKAAEAAKVQTAPVQTAAVPESRKQHWPESDKNLVVVATSSDGRVKILEEVEPGAASTSVAPSVAPSTVPGHAVIGKVAPLEDW